MQILLFQVKTQKRWLFPYQFFYVALLAILAWYLLNIFKYFLTKMTRFLFFTFLTSLFQYNLPLFWQCKSSWKFLFVSFSNLTEYSEFLFYFSDEQFSMQEILCFIKFDSMIFFYFDYNYIQSHLQCLHILVYLSKLFKQIINIKKGSE